MIYLVLKIKSTTVVLTGIPELLCWSCGVFSERVGSCRSVFVGSCRELSPEFSAN